MRKLVVLFVCLVFAASLIAAAGCAKQEEPAKPAAGPAKPAVEAPKPAEPPKAPEPEKKAEEAKPAEDKAADKAPEKK